MSKQGYSDPQLYPLDRNKRDLTVEWYVGFRFTCPKRQKREPFQVRLGINYQTTYAAREKEGNAVKKLVKECLDEGWNPFDFEIKKYLQEQQAETIKAQEEEARKKNNDPRYFGFNAAMDWAYNKKDKKGTTEVGLKSTLKYVKQAAVILGFSELPIGEITRFHVCEILDQMKVIRQEEYDKSKSPRFKGKRFTPNLYNANLNKLSALFFEYDNRGIIEYNPCHNIVKKDNIDFGVHRHPTEKELTIIKSELPKLHQGLYNFLRFEYITGMRPDEILDVRFDMVDSLNSCINISDEPYNADGELISKTTAYRQVPVPAFLLTWIREQSVGCSPNDYIFSLKLGAGSRRISSRWPSMLWRRIVIMKLGINVSLYSFKGLGGDAKRDAGVELAGVSAGYGHTTTNMARKVYLSKEGERLRQQLIELTPDL